MARLTREQSQTITREKLLASASDVVARDGYSGATIDRISEDAGFSKGAFYSNFSSKEDIFLQLLERNAGGDVLELTDMLETLADPLEVIDALAGWANERARDKRWGTLAVELLRMARRDETLSERHLRLFRHQWESLGRILIDKLRLTSSPPADPFYVGGIVFELTYGGISSFMKDRAPGLMVKTVLLSMYLGHGERHRRRSKIEERV